MPITFSSPSGGGGSPGLSLFASPMAQRAYLSRLQEIDLKKEPKDDSDEGIFGRLIPDIVQDAASQIGESLIYTIPGLYETGKALTLDTADLITEGDFTPERTGTIGKAMGQALIEDVRNPRENIGYLLLDILGAASLGAGTAARLGAAGKVAKAGKAARKPGFPPDAPTPVGFRPPGGPPSAPSSVLPVSGRGVGARHEAFERGPDMPVNQELMIAKTRMSLRDPLIPGKLYDARHIKGERFSTLGVYEKTVQRKGQDYHVFLDANTEKRRMIRDDQMRSLILNEPTAPNPQQAAAEALRRQSEAKKFATEGAPTWKPGDPFLHAGTGERLGVRSETGGLIPDVERTIGEGGKKVSPYPELTPEDRISIAAAERVKRAQEQEGQLKPEFANPNYQLQSRGPDVDVGEQMPDGSRLIVHPDKAHPGRYKVTHQPPGSRRSGQTIATFTSQLAAKVGAVQMGNRIRVGESPLHTASKKADEELAARKEIQTLMEKAPKLRVPSAVQFGLTQKQFPDVPADVLKSLTGDLRTAYVERGYQMPKPKEVLDIARNYMDDQAAINLVTHVYKTRGGSGGPSIRNLIGDVTRAFVRRPSPGTRRIEYFEEDRRKPMISYTTRTGEHKLGTGTLHRGDVLLSRNALVRTLQNAHYNIMERFPEKRIGPLRGLKPTTLKEEATFIAREGDRIMTLATSAGIFDQLRRAAQESQQAPRTRKKTAGDVVDQMNMAAKMGALFLKPAYMSANLLGQVWLSMTDHAWRPDHIVRSVRLQRALYDKEGPLVANRRAKKIKNAMSEGITAASAYESGLFRRVPLIGTEGMRFRGRKVAPGYFDIVEGYNKILDTPFRDNAFMNEAIRHGFNTPDKIAKLVDAEPGSPLFDKFSEIARRANRNIIDYGRLGPNEKRFVRRLIFFYPWFKGASIYGAHFFAEHPAQAALNVGISRYAQEKTEEELGPLPSYVRGAFKVGEREIPGLGKVPRIVNPAAATVLGTPGEVIQTGLAALAGGRTEASALSQHLTPGFSAMFAASTGIDPFTGREYSAKMSTGDIIAEQFGGTIAIKRLFENRGRARAIESGELDPERILFPYQEGGRNPFKDEALGRFVFGVSPYTLNPREARSRAAAEARTLEDKRTREVLKHRDYRDRYLEAGRKAGTFQEMPEELSSAFAHRAQKESEIAALGESLDRDLTQLDRLQAELQVLVRRGVFDEAQAKQFLESFAGTNSDSAVRSFRRRLSDVYFGGAMISRYRAILNASGAGLTIP